MVFLTQKQWFDVLDMNPELEYYALVEAKLNENGEEVELTWYYTFNKEQGIQFINETESPEKSYSLFFGKGNRLKYKVR